MLVTVSTKGQIVLPAKLRRRYGIDAGTRLSVVDFGGHISLVPGSEDPIRDARGMLGEGPSLTDALVAERAADRKREDGE